MQRRLPAAALLGPCPVKRARHGEENDLIGSYAQGTGCARKIPIELYILWNTTDRVGRTEVIVESE